MTQSEMQRRIAADGWCVIDAVIPPEAVAQVKDSILATAAAHKLPDPRGQLDKVSGLVNFDQSFVPYLAEPRLLGLCKALLGEHLRVSYTTCMVTHPGNARGAWHADWPFNQQNAGHVPTPYPDALLHVTTIWMLTAFTAETGTRDRSRNAPPAQQSQRRQWRTTLRTAPRRSDRLRRAGVGAGDG